MNKFKVGDHVLCKRNGQWLVEKTPFEKSKSKTIDEYEIIGTYVEQRWASNGLKLIPRIVIKLPQQYVTSRFELTKDSIKKNMYLQYCANVDEKHIGCYFNVVDEKVAVFAPKPKSPNKEKCKFCYSF